MDWQRPIQRINGYQNKQMGIERIPPPNYKCYRCGNSGHYISNCPTNGILSFDKPKPDTGIPKKRIRAEADEEFSRALASRKNLQVESGSAPSAEMICKICKFLLSNPINMPCCHVDLCGDCEANQLLFFFLVFSPAITTQPSLPLSPYDNLLSVETFVQKISDLTCLGGFGAHFWGGGFVLCCKNLLGSHCWFS